MPCRAAISIGGDDALKIHSDDMQRTCQESGIRVGRADAAPGAPINAGDTLFNAGSTTAPPVAGFFLGATKPVPGPRWAVAV